MIKTTFDDSTLIIESNGTTKCKDLVHKIGDVVVIPEDRVVVRFAAVGEKTPDQNIICYDKNCEALWRVQDPDLWRVGKQFPMRDVFVGIGLDEQGNLWGSGGQSRYRINTQDGSIIEEIFTK